MSVSGLELNAALLVNARELEERDFSVLAERFGIDPEGLFETARGHSLHWLALLGQVAPSETLLPAIWIEAFLTGVKIGRVFGGGS